MHGVNNFDDKKGYRVRQDSTLEGKNGKTV